MGQIISYCRKIVIFPIKLYQYFISPLIKPNCRFYPSCSLYAQDAINQFGIFKGLILALWRVLRCNPLVKGGYDPVIPNQEKN